MAAFVDKFLFKRYTKVTSLQQVAALAAPSLKLPDYITQGGESVAEACILDGPEGFSFDFTQAQAVSAQTDRGASHYEQWNSTYGQYFGSVKVSARALAGSKGREDAFLRQLAEVMDSGVKKFGHIAARKMLGPDGGNIGTSTGNSAGAGTAGDPGFSTTNPVMVLDDPKLSIHYAPGMFVSFSLTASGGVLIAGGTGTLKVTAVDITNGIITFTGTVGDALYLAVEDAADTPATIFVFRAGDYITGTDKGIQIRPLGFWNPAVAIVGTADVQNNVDRGQHELLSGCRLVAAQVLGKSIKERIELLINTMRNTAGAMETDHVFLHGNAWLALNQDIQSFGWLNFGQTMQIGAGELAIMTANGVVKIINEPHCPIGDIRAVTSKDWKVYNYDGFPGYAQEEGLKMVKAANSPDYEVRYQSFTCVTVNGKPWNFGYCPSGMT